MGFLTLFLLIKVKLIKTYENFDRLSILDLVKVIERSVPFGRNKLRQRPRPAPNRVKFETYLYFLAVIGSRSILI
jgi:hypothetical protein